MAVFAGFPHRRVIAYCLQISELQNECIYFCFMGRNTFAEAHFFATGLAGKNAIFFNFCAKINLSLKNFKCKIVDRWHFIFKGSNKKMSTLKLPELGTHSVKSISSTLRATSEGLVTWGP